MNEFGKKQLLIIGNGFDLACGLKSSYVDFFNECIKDNFDINDINSSYVQDFWQILLKCHSQTQSPQNQNWCDIEKIILTTIQEIKKELLSSAWYKLQAQRNNQPVNNNGNDIIKKFKLEYLVYLLFGIFQGSSQPDDKRFKLVYKHLFKELNNLEKQFCEYLKNAMITSEDKKKLKEDYLVKPIYYLDKLTKFIKYNERLTNIDLETIGSALLCESIETYGNYSTTLNNVSILSFNYTNPFSFTGLDKKLKIINVHGKLCGGNCEECGGTSAIFGIDDNEVNGDENLRMFSKTYRKLFLKDENKKILPNKKDEVVIKFFGHSLNKADYSYFQSIFDYYDIYANSLVSLEFFYKIYDTQKKDKLLSDATTAVYDLIEYYGDNSFKTNPAQGKNLMHKLLLENRIKIIDIDA